jgi:hypothetical protein
MKIKFWVKIQILQITYLKIFTIKTFSLLNIWIIRNILK